MRVLRFTFMAGAILAFGAACGGGTTATTGPGATTAPPAAACTGTVGTPVAIATSAFSPQSVTVAVGATVTWTNADATTHTVTFNEGPDCGRLSQAQTVTRTFDTAGSFAYHCAIHATMKGTVVVQ